MSNRYACILAAGCAAVLVAALGVTPALAEATARTWTVRPGGGITATSSGQFALTDTTTGITLVCSSSTASGMLKGGGGLPGSHAGSLSAVSFVECRGPGDPLFNLQPAGLLRREVFTLQAGGLPWQVNFSSYNAAKGVVRGTISHIHIVANGVGCTPMIDGTGATAGDGQVVFRYTDSTGRLRVLTTFGNLHVYDVSAGCLGEFKDGDLATLSATYAVNPKQTITSP
jgi:hypothetical protein